MKWYSVFTQGGRFVASVLAWTAFDAIDKAIAQNPARADGTKMTDYKVVEIKA